MKTFWGSFFLALFFGVLFIPCRSFEEENQSKTKTTTTTTTMMKPKTDISQQPVILSKNPSSTPQGSLVRIWPGSHEDAGVLILSDSDPDDSCESDED